MSNIVSLALFPLLVLIFPAVFTNSERTCDKEFIIRRAATNRVLNVLRHWVSKHSQVSLHPPTCAQGPLLCWGEHVCGLIKADAFSPCSAACVKTNTHCILLPCHLHKRLYSPESAYPLFCQAASVAPNELNIKVIARLPARRSVRSDIIDLLYAFSFDNTKRRDNKPAVAQTHTSTPTRVSSFRGQRTKSLFKKSQTELVGK